jgi:hypothetical protein
MNPSHAREECPMQDAVKNALQERAVAAESGRGRRKGKPPVATHTRSWTDASEQDTTSMPAWTRTAFRE